MVGRHGTLTGYTSGGCRCDACRGAATRHRREWRWRTGRSKRRQSSEARFWEKVTKSEGEEGCWLWTAALSRGYGVFKAAGSPRNQPAHRFAYELLVGPIPDGLDLDHLCHEPASCLGGESCAHRRCVNPAHLTPTTRGENIQRGQNHNRRKTCCPTCGGPYSLRASGRRICRPCNNERLNIYKRKWRAERRRKGLPVI